MKEITREFEMFAYTLVHDFRAPIRAISSFSSLLLEQHGDKLGEEGRALIERMGRAAQRQDSLVRDLVAACYLGTTEPKTELVNPEQLARDIIQDRPYLQPPRTEIRIEIPLLPMRAHAGFLGQCLSHFLENAAEFFAPAAKPLIRIWTERLNGDVRLWIEARSVALSEKNRERSLNMFQGLNATEACARGGISLAIVRRAAERMGGSVGISSTRGGRGFWIQLSGKLWT
jgi:light-regulated signal transduction histidine kinase (bacteriophytochrome)